MGEAANAKLTRRLRITGRRSDGYHLLDAEMVTVDLSDQLEFVDGEGLELHDEIRWSGARPTVMDEVPTGEDNLVSRALAATGRTARVRLTKRIPPGGGLGGASADAAAVLRWSGVTDPMVGAKLGADVPFCMLGGRAAVGGVGEELELLDHLDLIVVLVTPGFAVSTPLAYRAYDELERAGELPGDLRNVLEPAAMVVEPRLAKVKAVLSSVAGDEPSLAGSGSTYFFECSASSSAQLLASEASQALAEAGLSSAIEVVRTTPAYGTAVGGSGTRAMERH